MKSGNLSMHWLINRFCKGPLLFVILLAGFGIPGAAFANDEYYRHIFFDNSLTSDSYFYSSASAFAPSTLEQKNSKLPVETGTFLTPPNALRLEWQSLESGNWQAEIKLVNFRNRFPGLRGNTLFLWCFAPQAISAGDLHGGFAARQIFWRHPRGPLGTDSHSLFRVSHDFHL